MKKWLIMIAVVLVIVVATGGLWGWKLKKMLDGMAAAGVPKQTVSTTIVESSTWQGALAAVGTVRAQRGADLALEVGGVVDSIGFESGMQVAAGFTLLTLRDDDGKAQLALAENTLRLAQLTFERDKKQVQEGLISQAQFEQSDNALRSAQLTIKQLKAQTDKKQLRTPFAGRLGLRQVDEGQFVQAGTKVVTLQALDKVYVDFSLPQRYAAIATVGQPVTLQADAFGKETFLGKVSAVESVVDTATRNLNLRATVGNASKKLLPGMFVNVQLGLNDMNEYLTLPTTAISYNPYGESVFVVTTLGEYEAAQAKENATAAAAALSASSPAAKADNKPKLDPSTLVVKQVFVKLGPTRGGQVAVLSGIKAGDEVVTSGQIKLKGGTHIKIKNDVQPKSDANPQPVDE